MTPLMPHPPGDGEHGPVVEISPARVACPGHGEHLRAKWPSGFAVFSLTIFQAAVESKALLEACGWKPGQSVPVERINEVTQRRPFCYFVERDVIRKALHECGILTIGLCARCARPGLGGPYDTLWPTGVEHIAHLCVECALDTGERIHREHPKGGVWRD